MSGNKYRSDKGGKGEKYMSSYRDNEGSSKPSYSAAYDDHYSSHSQPPKVGSVKVAREQQQQHRSPNYHSLYDLKKSHKNKSDYSREFKDSTSKKLKSKEDYYYYRDERDVYKDEYYDDSHKAVSSAASSKKYFVDDGFKGNQQHYHSERAHKEMPFKDPYKSKGNPSYEESYKSQKSYDPYDAPPAKSYKEYHRAKKYSVSPPRKISRRSYSFSPPPNKQAPAYDNYREAEIPKSHHSDFRGRGRSMNKPRGDYREANNPSKPMESDFRGTHMNKMRMQDFRGGASGTKGRGINGGNVGRFDNYTAPPLPAIEQRGRAYDSFSNSYEGQRDDPYYRPQPPLPTKEKKYSQYNEVERLPKSVDPPAQLSRYVIGDSVVYGSPGHYPHGLVSPRRYSLSPPRRSKYPPKEVSMSPPGLDATGSFRQQTPSLSPHYPLYDQPMRRTPPARESKRKRSHSPLRPATKRTESASNKRPPSPLPPRNTRNSFSPSFKHSRNAGAPQPVSHTEGSASDRQWSGGKTIGGPSRSGGAKQSQSGSLGRRNVSSPTRKDPPPKDSSASDKGSGKSRSSSRRSQSPGDHRNKNQHSKHTDDRSSPSSKKPLLNNPPTLPVNSEQGLLGAKPLLLCTPPLLSLPAPPLMGVRPAMPMLPPILGRPGGLLDGRLGLVGGGFKRLPGDAVRGGRLGGRGRGNMRRPMDLRGLIESRKERHQPPMGRFVPPGHRHGEGPVHDARRQPPDGEGRRGWHQDNRMNPPRPMERFPHNDGRPQQVVPRVRDRLLNRGVRPLVARKPLVSRVPRITNRKLLPASRPLGAAGMQGPGAPRPRPAGPAAGGQVRSNRSPTGGRSGVRGVPARVPVRPKLSALVSNRNAVLKKYQRLTGRARAGANEGGARRAMAGGRGAGMQATRKKPLQQQERDNQRRGDDKTHRKQESDDHRRDDGAPWRRESGGGRKGDDSRGGREARDRRDNLAGAGRARRGNSQVRDGKKKSAASSPRKLDKSQCNVRGAIDRSPKVSSTTGSSNNSNNKNKRRLSRSPSSSSSADSYKRHRANSVSRRDSSGSRYSRSPRHNKFSRSSPPYPAKNSSASSHRRSKYSPSPKPNSKYSSKSSRPAMRHSRSRSRSSSGSISSLSRGRKSASPSLSP